VRRGAESGGSFEKMAELPKVEPAVGSAFLFWRNRIETREVVKRQYYMVALE